MGGRVGADRQDSTNCVPMANGIVKMSKVKEHVKLPSVYCGHEARPRPVLRPDSLLYNPNETRQAQQRGSDQNSVTAANGPPLRGGRARCRRGGSALGSIATAP